jgi:hypothetical protein
MTLPSSSTTKTAPPPRCAMISATSRSDASILTVGTHLSP